MPEDGTTEEDLIEHCADASLILHCYTPITRRVIQSASYLRGIVKYGVGTDAIDIVAAKERGIPVANVPLDGERPVAEGEFEFLIYITQKMNPLCKCIKEDGWVWLTEEWLGNSLYGKAVGLVGCGRIELHSPKCVMDSE